MSEPAPSTLPAPWYVQSWRTHDDRTLYRACSADHQPITDASEDPRFAEAVVRSRNEGTVEADVASVRERYEAALASCRGDTERVRAAWHKESGSQLDTIRRLQLKLLTLREKFGVLEPGDAVLLAALREDLEPPAVQGRMFRDGKAVRKAKGGAS